MHVIIIKCHFYIELKTPRARTAFPSKFQLLRKSLNLFFPFFIKFNYLFNKTLLKQSNISYSIWLANYKKNLHSFPLFVDVTPSDHIFVTGS